MVIAVAQTRAYKLNVKANITQHISYIDKAIKAEADLIIFPELSLTGYEPRLAKKLVMDKSDPRLNEFQKMSDKYNISIGVGLPSPAKKGIFISMVIFAPHMARIVYSKRQLHEDELPYFVEGKNPVVINLKGQKAVPAICYEALQERNAKKAHELGADVFLASVAKSQNGVQKAFNHFPLIAKKYSMHVLMANCVGTCDDFQSAGNSAIWNKEGSLVAQLSANDEGLLIYDTSSHAVSQKDGLSTSVS